jgi:hypothetical protein
MKRLVRGEKGYVLIAALLVLIVVGLISGPLLSYMVSGLKAGHTFETGTAELYAADAGVQDAMWRIPNLGLCSGSPTAHYAISGVNGKVVDVYVEYLSAGSYRITSTAVTDDTGNTAGLGSHTAVEAYLSAQYLDLSSLLDNAVVSDTDITIDNGVSITGNVTSGGTVDNKAGDDVNGTITTDADLSWPSAEDLSAYYLAQVQSGVHYYSDTTIDLNGISQSIGPLYVDGKLTIVNSSNTLATLTLTGTVYATGDTLVRATAGDLTLDLNGQTIFVASATAGSHQALSVGGKCSIVGPGCVIAVGDVYFAPKGDVGSEDGFVLVMSVDGTTTLQPSGTFYGCVAGNLAVDVQSGKDAIIINNGLGERQDLNFPSGVGDDPNQSPVITSVQVESWDVSRQ